ncbi:MAG: DUF533 domain-containing protein, partial [Zoogloeaceae bacterium]|nr:DUF533 domain-containing protein [Zoogloeaceae bacterium]
MFDAKRLLDQIMQGAQSMVSPPVTTTPASTGPGLLGHPAVSGALGGVGGGLLAGLLMNSKAARKVATYGGAAALGAVAITAYRNWQANKQAAAGANVSAQAATPLDFDRLPAGQQAGHSRAMLAALIAAAKADGQFDAAERQLIREQAAQFDDAQAAAWIQAEIDKPLDVAEVAALA